MLDLGTFLLILSIIAFFLSFYLKEVGLVIVGIILFVCSLHFSQDKNKSRLNFKVEQALNYHQCIVTKLVSKSNSTYELYFLMKRVCEEESKLK